jgi:hypothetical protein
MKKSLLIFGLVFFAVSMQVGAATMSWVSTPTGSTISPASSKEITAYKTYFADVDFDNPLTLEEEVETLDFTFNIDADAGISSSAIEFNNAQLTINSVTLLTGGLSYVFNAIDTLGKWSLGNILLASGDHTIRVAVASALEGGQLNIKVNSVPVPAAIWLFGSALMGLAGFSSRKTKSALSVA